MLAGYTNAGKSSLLNRLTDAGVLVENALFATLDPTVRRCRDRGRPARTRWPTRSGFVRHLPTQLIEAFRSTLEEVAEADLILHVVDASDADPEAQIRAVREVLADIDALGVPEQLVFNKVDAAEPEVLLRLRRLAPDGVVRLGADRRRASTSCAAASRSGCPARTSRWTSWCPTRRGDLVARACTTGPRC